MIQELSCRAADYLVSHGADPQQKEVFSYSMECLFNLLISDFLLFSIGLFLHRIPELIIWCTSYTLLRVNIGGYHASTHARCIISGTLVGLLSLPLNKLWALCPPSVILLCCAILLDIALFAPVPHPHHPVSGKGRKKARIRAYIVTISGFLLVFLFQYFKIFITNSILSGFACALLLAWIGTTINAKKGVSHETT